MDKLVRDTYLTKRQTSYYERGTNCYVDFLDEEPSIIKRITQCFSRWCRTNYLNEKQKQTR
jgi:hypothetical protein